MTINEVLPVVLYILGSVLLVVLIILTIRLIITMNKVDKLVDNITVKVTALDELFAVVGSVSGKFARITDVLVDNVALLVEKIFRGKGE